MPNTDIKIYVNATEAKKALCAYESDLEKWRKQGMPHKVVKGSRGKYIYCIEDCQKWFRGEESA